MDNSKTQRKGFLGAVERIGNALPHPAILFFIFSIIVIIASELVARMGTSVTYYDARAGEEVTKSAVSLLNGEGLRYIFNNATSNFTGFAPLGTVLVAMLGVGVAENTGLISAALKNLITSVPRSALTAVVVFAGIMSNIASDAGYVVVIPLGAIVFSGAGRHPIAGLAAAFAGVSAGFSANLAIGTLDPLLSGITNEALKSVGMVGEVLPSDNYFFMAASTFLLTAVGVLVTDKFIEPRLGEYTGSYKPNHEPLTATEKKGLNYAGISLLVFVAIMAYLMIKLPGNLPGNGVFLEPDASGKMVLNNFLGKGLLLAILLMFLIPGAIYGKVTGVIKDSNDLIGGMTEAMKSMGAYMVLAFFASQFINYFSYTNLGLLVSFKGAELLQNIGFVGLPLIIAFVILSAFLNLFMGSASAKWAVMAPIFVPMMAQLNIAPEFTQLAYRIGDSTTNIITPLMSYFAMIVVFAKRYDENSGLGTLISTMLPYSFFFLISWLVLLVIWYVTGLPIGPGGAGIHTSMNLISTFFA